MVDRENTPLRIHVQWNGQVEAIIDVRLLQIRRQFGDERPAEARGRQVGIRSRDQVLIAGRKGGLRIVVIVQRDAELFQIIAAFHPVGGLTNLLDGGQQEADQDGDDGDHYQQLNQGESRSAIHRQSSYGNFPQDDEIVMFENTSRNSGRQGRMRWKSGPPRAAARPLPIAAVFC